MSEEDYGQTGQTPPPEPSMPMYEDALAKASNQATTYGLAGSGSLHVPTVTELLEHKKRNLEIELSRVNHALDVAKKNQGAMDLIDSIAKTRVHG